MKLNASKFIYRDDREELLIARRILRQLEVNHIASFYDLCRPAKTSIPKIRNILETMIEQRQIRRLRPVEFAGEAYDYYVLPLGNSRPARRKSKGWKEAFRRNVIRRLFMEDILNPFDHFWGANGSAASTNQKGGASPNINLT